LGYDIIGDVHGHNERLEALLEVLGYEQRNRAWRHPTRQAIFVGDFIDRGPGQLATLELVCAMIDAGSARAVMGNHEFNAIAWATPDPQDPGRFLRPRDGDLGEKNFTQHEAFLTEVECDSTEHDRWIQWFMDLPLWIEEPDFQVIHACWSPKAMEVVRPELREGRLTPEVVEAASRKGHALYEAVETLLKGAEVPLPPGYSFRDKDGHERHEIRTKWWDLEATAFREAYLGPPGVEIPDIPIPRFERIPQPALPTFVGHYWMPQGGPFAPVSGRVACVDFSAGKGGPLVAYRFDGEDALAADRFVVV
jgi:hypothetical protein